VLLERLLEKILEVVELIYLVVGTWEEEEVILPIGAVRQEITIISRQTVTRIRTRTRQILSSALLKLNL
jgi:hypothetical protein